MNNGRRIMFLVLFLGAVAGPGFRVIADVIQGGRYQPTDARFSLSARAGYLGLDEGEVRETRRAYDVSEGEPDYKAFLSAYTLEDLNLDGTYPALGLGLEKQWRFWTLSLKGTYANPSTDAVAKMKPTASGVPPELRGYYIGVHEAVYNGKNYEYMWIPDGTRFTAEAELWLAELRLMFTPFNIGSEYVRLSPWAHVGIFGALASYEIDAGPPEGIVYYEVPPKPYVIKGKGTGTVGVGIPEIGGGAELRIAMGQPAQDYSYISVRGDVNWIQLAGAPGEIGLNLETTRHVDFNWLRMGLEVEIGLPVGQKSDLLLGVAYWVITTDVSLDSIHRTEEAQAVLSEKYDKYAEFQFSQVMAYLGLRF